MADEEKTKTTPQPPPPDTPQSIKLEDIHDLPGVMIRKRIDRDLGGLVQSIKSQGVMELWYYASGRTASSRWCPATAAFGALSWPVRQTSRPLYVPQR